MSQVAKGAVIAGKYRLDTLLGRGGMGSVWVAYHLQLKTKVALKFIDAVPDAIDARARFEREANVAADLRSPHVVQILDYGVDRDQPYIAMELLEGEDLGERLRREKRLSVKAAATILTQTAKALRRAHDMGVIHRDLKPSNIFLARFDEDEVVKILDFGVAKIRNPDIDTTSEFTQTGVIFGSPAYMSPEQARGIKGIDHRSDLWSLAVILFRALTGVKPFEASSIGDLVIKLCIDPLPLASRFVPDLSPEIDQFFLKAFARELAERFPSAMTMAAEFNAIAARPAAPALPPPREPAVTVPVIAAPPTQVLEQPWAAAPAEPSPRAWAPPAEILPPPPPPSAPSMVSPQPPITGAPTGPFPAPPPMPSVTPQPPSRTPSPALRTVVSSPRAPVDPRRVARWAAIGAGGFVLLVLIIGLSRSGGSQVEPGAARPLASTEVVAPAQMPTAVAAPSPPVPQATVESSAAPSAEPEPGAASPPSAAPDSSAVPEVPEVPSVEATGSSAAPFPSARPLRPGGKAGKGRVPNFGY